MSEPTARENYYPLKMPTEVYQALIDRMSKTKLSKGDCLIDMLTETVYREGYLPKDQYDFLKKRYGTKTVLEKVLEGRRLEVGGQAPPITRVQLAEDVRIANLEKEFKMALDQWDLHPSLEWRLKWHKKAEQNKDVSPSARRLVELAASAEPLKTNVDDKLERALGHD
jgi:hypothetical protein